MKTMLVLPQIKIRMSVLRLPTTMIEVFILDSRWAISITFTHDPSMRMDEAQSEMELEFKTIMTVAEVGGRKGVV